MAFVKMTVKGMDGVNATLSGFAAPDLAISRAINKAVAKAKTETWAQVKSTFPVKQSLLYKSIKLLKSNQSTLLGKMIAYNSKWSYVDVGGARQLKAGVKVQPRRGGYKTSKDLFFKTGTKTILTRKKTGSGVEAVKTWSAAQMLDEPPGQRDNILWRVQLAAATAYEKELDRQIDLMMAKGK